MCICGEMEHYSYASSKDSSSSTLALISKKTLILLSLPMLNLKSLSLDAMDSL